MYEAQGRAYARRTVDLNRPIRVRFSHEACIGMERKITSPSASKPANTSLSVPSAVKSARTM